MFHVLVYHPSIFHNTSFVEMLMLSHLPLFSHHWLHIVTSFFLWFLLLFIKRKVWEKAFLKVKFIFSITYLVSINIDMVRLSFAKVFPKFSSSTENLLCICRIQLLLPTSKCIHMHHVITANSQIIAFEVLAVKIFTLMLVLQKFKFIILGILKYQSSIRTGWIPWHSLFTVFVAIFFTFFLHLLNRFSAVTVPT